MFGIFKNKKRLKPFSSKPLADSAITLELIYDISAEQPRWSLLKEEHQIELEEGALIIRGRRFSVNEKVTKIFLTSLGTLIIRDFTPYQNIHAYSLKGEFLWDIEGCLSNTGDKAYSFGDPVEIKKSEAGRDLLILHRFPVTYATDLLTGKGSYILAIADDTNVK